jgi:hypothetical protein
MAAAVLPDSFHKKLTKAGVSCLRDSSKTPLASAGLFGGYHPQKSHELISAGKPPEIPDLRDQRQCDQHLHTVERLQLRHWCGIVLPGRDLFDARLDPSTLLPHFIDLAAVLRECQLLQRILQFKGLQPPSLLPRLE